jgi:hypothetical protein
MSFSHFKSFFQNPIALFLVVLIMASTFGLQGWRTLLNNFAVEEAGIDGNGIGIIQSVREIPGFLAFFFIFIIRFVSEKNVASLSILLMGISILFTGYYPSISGLVLTTLLMSTGFHYFETANQSLSLQFFAREEAPLFLSYTKSIAAITAIAAGGIILLLNRLLESHYGSLFAIIGVVTAALGFASFFIGRDSHQPVPQKKKFLLRKNYWLFYVLTFLAGARRQIFVAFAVFLLVKKFNFTIETIAFLFIINNVINFFLMPYIGKFIVRFGERKLLSIEYASLLLIFITYAYTESKILVMVLYVLDHVLFGFSLGIKTFFQKIARQNDIAPSMAVGFSINHIAAVVIPFAGGLMWMIDYKLPFFLGAILALVSFIFVQFIRTDDHDKLSTTA